jgi:hypothetical protein
MNLLGARMPLLALAATAGVLATSWSILSRSDELIGRSYADALAERPQVARAGTPAGTGPQTELDLLQLSSAPAEQPFGLSRPVARGDRITITGRDGQARSLEVTEVRSLPAGTATGASNVLLVTCKVAGSEPAAVVRFVVESAAPDAEPTPLVHRAL